MAGWCFLLLHYAAHAAADAASGPVGGVARLISLAALGLCALCFFYAAAERVLGTSTRVFVWEAGAAVLVESAVLAFGIRSAPMHMVAACLFALPGLHLPARVRTDWKAVTPLTAGVGLLGILIFSIEGEASSMLGGAMLCVLFLTAAGFTQATQRPGLERGTSLMAAGLAGWGLSYPLSVLLPADSPGSVLLAELPQYVVAYGMIVSLLQQQVGRMEELALLNPLTGLPNTRHLESRLDRVFAMSAQHGNPIACMVIDVDRFKQINDTLGKSVGDELLKALAVRLAWHIGPRDTLAHTGSDDFIALLVSEHDEHHLHFLARAMIAAVGVPVSVGKHTLAVTISAGIAVSATGAHGLPELRRAADEAMYQAKRNGGGQLVVAHSAD